MIACSGYRGNFVTVAGVVDVWLVALGRPPVTAGEGEEEKDQRAQHHDAAAEVEGQVVGLRVVEEPPWGAAKGEQTSETSTRFCCPSCRPWRPSCYHDGGWLPKDFHTSAM